MPKTEDKVTKIIGGDVLENQADVEEIDSKGALNVNVLAMSSGHLPGLQMPTADAIVVTSPDATSDLYTYKTGGVSGTIVGTITVTYTDSTKVTISSVVKELPS